MDDEERWLAEELQLAGPCPACTAAEARPIVYGMRVPDFYERLSGRAAFFGCCVPEVPHRWACGACGHAWGQRRTYDELEDVGAP